MSEDCIFCQIVDGEIPSSTVYEDDDVYAFLDVNPLTRGHTLVIPKEHHSRVEELPAGTGSALFTAVYELADPVQAAVDADGATIGINNGEVAGQDVPHVHAHVIPRFEGDAGGSLHTAFTTGPDIADDEFDEIAAAIADQI